MSITETRAAPLDLWREAETLIRQIFALFGAPDEIAFQHTLTAKAHKLLAQWLRGAEALLRQLLLIEAAAYGPASRLDFGAANTTPASTTPAGEAAAIREKYEHHSEQPESWRVSFRIFMDRRRPAGSVGRRGRSITERNDDAWRYDMVDPDSLVSSPASGGSVGRNAHDEGGGAQPAASSTAPSVSSADTSPASGGGKKFFSAWPLAERAEALLRVFNNPAPYARRLARALFAHPERAERLVRVVAHRGVVPAPVAEIVASETAPAAKKIRDSS